MHTYLVLIRGINVGLKNRLSMAELRTCLEKLGFANVSTYIASGNVILQSSLSAAEVKAVIELGLPQTFTLEDDLIKVHVLSKAQLQSIIEHRPAGFGEQPSMFHSDVIFLMGVSAAEAIKVFNPREGVDTVWPGDGVIYHQRLSSERTKSRLSKIMSSPVYQSMTVRTYGTVTKVLALMEHTA